jgi:hypothetical protein
MRTVFHKGGIGGRKLETPTWALNDAELLRVLAYYLERRAGFTRRQAGTTRERIERAHQRLLAREPGLSTALNGLCRQYVELKRSGTDPARLAVLQSEILTVDSTILSNARPALPAVVVMMYHRARMDSPAISMELKISPQHVRRTLFRMAEAAKRLQDGDPPGKSRGRKPKQPEPGMSPEEKSRKESESAKVRWAKVRAEKAALADPTIHPE